MNEEGDIGNEAWSVMQLSKGNGELGIVNDVMRQTKAAMEHGNRCNESTKIGNGARVLIQ